MTDRSQDTLAEAHAPMHDVKLLVELMRSCRVMLAYGEPGEQRDHLFRYEIAPQLRAVGPGGRKEVVILFDAWDGRPLPALQARIQTALADTARDPIPGSTSDQSFANVLRSWQEACNVTCLIILDHFNKYLTAPAEDDDRREFEDEFVQAANDNTLRSNFLLVLDHDVEPLLARLRARLPFLGNESIRLPAVRAPAKQAVEVTPKDMLLTGAPDIPLQQPAVAPPMSATTSKALAAPLFSLRIRELMPQLALVVVVFALVSAGVSLMQRTPEPTATLTEERRMPAVGIEKNVNVAPTPRKATTSEVRLREARALNEPKKTAARPSVQGKQPASVPGKAAGPTKDQSAHPKPHAASRRPSSATAGQSKKKANSASAAPRGAHEPAAPPSKPATAMAKREETMIAAVEPRLTVDQAYEQRTGKECKPGLVGVICREKIRYQLCAGKWTPEDQPGITRCQLW